MKRYDVKLQSFTEKNEALEKKLESVVQSVTDMCEIIVRKSVDIVFQRQDEIEKKQNKTFDLINENLAKIIVQSQSSCHSPAQLASQPLAQPSPQPASATKFQCDVCGKTFGSGRALANHDRKDHKP